MINSSLTLYFRHVVPKALSAENVTEGLVDTFGENPEKINIKKVDGNVQVEFTANGETITATVKTPNIIAKNGIIHEVDKILFNPPTPNPTDDLIKVLTDRGNFGKLIQALNDLTLTDTLNSAEEKTIFAPNDAAFVKLTGADFETLADTAEKIKIIKR